MRIVAVLVLILSIFATLAAQSANVPIKLGEYEKNGQGCEEYVRIEDLFDNIAKNKGSHGLIVIYAGDKKERYGNVEAYVENAEVFATDFLKHPADKLKIVIGEGKGFFNEEFWLVPEGASEPVITRASFDWNQINANYLFSYTCLLCEPSYPRLSAFQANFKKYAGILQENNDLEGLITVHDYIEIKMVERSLTGEFKLPRNRYKIQIKTNPEVEDGVDLHLIPKHKINATRKSTNTDTN